MNNILDFTLLELKAWFKNQNESEYRAKQVFDFIYRNVWDFDDMNNIPITIRKKLNEAFYIGIPKVVEIYESSDKNTTKYLLMFNDGNVIETVTMKYTYGYSICLSTQVGCRMGCKFCASTVNGMVKNLTSGEILAEILAVEKIIGTRISNVVLMGSGEPLDNFNNVIKFINIVNADYSLNIGQRHITLSTCGIVPKIKEIADMKMQITLAISLHAANDELRKNIMPISNKYSIKELIDICKYYTEKTNRRITFEYSLIKEINDREENAIELSNLLKGTLCHVNLIPVNKVTDNTFEKSTKESIIIFSNILNKFGIQNTVRREMGTDINAACGQLRRKYIELKGDNRGE
ncbi:MAG: 23S rRNA (adenine(2503)-C(2))-methyltransferase RlmN [Bacillota bacterium]|nr:23S rRNA (adenine(2503)-C(2))-methyltransferase RlmN [Bacillota bacterium]